MRISYLEISFFAYLFIVEALHPPLSPSDLDLRLLSIDPFNSIFAIFLLSSLLLHVRLPINPRISSLRLLLLLLFGCLTLVSIPPCRPDSDLPVGYLPNPPLPVGKHPQDMPPPPPPPARQEKGASKTKASSASAKAGWSVTRGTQGGDMFMIQFMVHIPSRVLS